MSRKLTFDTEAFDPQKTLFSPIKDDAKLLKIINDDLAVITKTLIERSLKCDVNADSERKSEISYMANYIEKCRGYLESKGSATQYNEARKGELDDDLHDELESEQENNFSGFVNFTKAVKNMTAKISFGKDSPQDIIKEYNRLCDFLQLEYSEIRDDLLPRHNFDNMLKKVSQSPSDNLTAQDASKLCTTSKVMMSEI